MTVARTATTTGADAEPVPGALADTDADGDGAAGRLGEPVPDDAPVDPDALAATVDTGVAVAPGALLAGPAPTSTIRPLGESLTRTTPPPVRGEAGAGTEAPGVGGGAEACGRPAAGSMTR